MDYENRGCYEVSIVVMFNRSRRKLFAKSIESANYSNCEGEKLPYDCVEHIDNKANIFTFHDILETNVLFRKDKELWKVKYGSKKHKWNEKIKHEHQSNKISNNDAFCSCYNIKTTTESVHSFQSTSFKAPLLTAFCFLKLHFSKQFNHLIVKFWGHWIWKSK